jgi:hypothetical protein
MMSCTTFTALSRPVSSPYYSEYGQCRGAVLSGRITIVAMSRSDQLGRCCTIELNGSDLSARLAVASVTHARALETCEPSCVPGVARPFFIPVIHSPLGVVGGMWQHQSSSLGEAEPRAMGHVAVLEPTSTGRRGPELRNTWQR